MAEIFDYISPPELIRTSTREDRYEKRVSNWITAWNGKEPFDVALLSVPFGRASLNGSSGTALAPNAIRQAFPTNTTYSPDFDVDLQPQNKSLLCRASAFSIGRTNPPAISFLVPKCVETSHFNSSVSVMWLCPKIQRCLKGD